MPKKRRKRRMGLSAALRAAIRKSGLTHYRIGKNAGVVPDVLDRFVSGQRSLRLDTAEKICGALGLVLVERDELQE